MSELPSGWVQFSLKDVGGLSGGKTPSKANPAFWSSPDVPWVSPKDMKRNLLEDAEDRISQVALSEAGMTLYPAGSVLMVTRSGILQHTFPVALAGAELTVNQDIKVLRPVEGIAPKFSFYMLKSFGSEILSLCSKDGTTVQSIDSDKLEAFELPLPPLAEQTRIAAKLDELLAQVDTLKARIDGIPALLKRFRQSVLAAAVSGRLTEEWRRLQPDRDSHNSVVLPTGWTVVPLGSYAINHDGARKPISAKERDSRKGDHPYFGATGQIDNIDGYTHDGEFVLVGEDGANLLTRVKPIAFIAKGQIWVNNHAHVIASPAGHSNDYLAIYLNTLDITPWVSGSAQPKLNQKNMNEIPVHVPPTAEQAEIVRRVEQLFAIADQLEARVVAAKTRIDHLTQSILAKAFRGELVPQDPNDEPASVLLERINAQRAAAPKAKRGRKATA